MRAHLQEYTYATDPSEGSLYNALQVGGRQDLSVQREMIEGVDTMSQSEFIKTSYRENGELCYWTIGYQLGEIVELDKN